MKTAFLSIFSLYLRKATSFHLPALPWPSTVAQRSPMKTRMTMDLRNRDDHVYMMSKDKHEEGFYPFPRRSLASISVAPGRRSPRWESKLSSSETETETSDQGDRSGGALRQLLGLKGVCKALTFLHDVNGVAFLNQFPLRGHNRIVRTLERKPRSLKLRASTTENIWKIRLQLTKPVTWVPLIWGVTCGAAASGNYHWWNPFGGDVSFELGSQDLLKALGCMILSGPFLTGFTQTINDWYDREIDAINEPYRPIPSGAISKEEVIAQIWVLLLGGLGIAYGLDVWAEHEFPIVFSIAVFGSIISYIYSAPPLKLKQNGWLGNYALGSSYISLPWWCGQAMFGELNLSVVILTLLYSWAGLGIAIVNDFKSVEGDREMGLQSLPVAFGVERAKWICVASIDVTQLGIAAWLYSIGEPTYAAVLTALVMPQVFAQFKYFLPDPVENDVKYQATAQPFLVLGILTTALAVGHHPS